MNVQIGTNRLVIVTKKYVYKFPIGLRGFKANKAEYQNAKNCKLCAKTDNFILFIRQERLFDTFSLPYCFKHLEIPPEWKELWDQRLHNRFQVGRDAHGHWKFYDYEDVKHKDS